VNYRQIAQGDNLMDVKLENIIEKIRKEAVEKGQSESDAIIEEAREKADQVIKDAEEKAEAMVKEAEKEAENMRKNSCQAIKQAARDIELSLKEKITLLFDRVFKNAVGQTMKPEFLESLISDIVKHWNKKGSVDIAVNDDIRNDLEKVLFAGLDDELKKSVTLTPAPGLTHGFRVKDKDGSVYYDFSDETIAETLKAFISPNLRDILNNNEKKNG
jgi:V/A-type H+/Na+-transporting ATPase subunit E